MRRSRRARRGARCGTCRGWTEGPRRTQRGLALRLARSYVMSAVVSWRPFEEDHVAGEGAPGLALRRADQALVRPGDRDRTHWARPRRGARLGSGRERRLQRRRGGLAPLLRPAGGRLAGDLGADGPLSAG